MRIHFFSYPLRLIPMIFLCVTPSIFYSQEKSQQAPRKQTAGDGTIRIDVGLVQTDVMVFDRQGRFVDKLTPDQFELRVDGKPQRIDFFDLISEGEPARKDAGGRLVAPFTPPGRAQDSGSELGRTLLFFLDDWHLSADSLMRTRSALGNLIDNAMGPNDRAAIFAASRQLGFLQQLTDNKTVLKQALTRLRFTNECVEDLQRPPMNEAQAVAIEQKDPDVLGYFVDATMKVEGLNREMATQIVLQRASSLAHLSSQVTTNSLAVLAAIVQSCAALPGRKLFFYLSDGFVLQPQKSDIFYRLRLVSEAAVRSGVVIYTLDTRGLVAYSYASSGPIYAGLERLSGLNEVFANQDGLNALASDTGGRFLKNTNALDAAIVQSLGEASRYYLLGWHIDPRLLQPGQYSSVRVVLRGRPDLRLQARQTKMDLSRLIAKPPARIERPKPDPKEKSAIVKAIEFPWPIDTLPTHLYAGYIRDPAKGHLVNISMQADLEWPPAEAGARANQPVEVMAVVANRDGKAIITLKDSISEPGKSASPSKPGTKPFTHNWVVPLDPGIYQVRVAAHDPNTGLTGSDHKWIDLPRVDASQPVRKIQLGSIFVRARREGDPVAEISADSFDLFAAERRFTTDSRLLFVAQMYNEASYPVNLEFKIYLGNRIVMRNSATIEKPAAPTADFSQIKGDLPLAQLGPGAYVMELTVTDPSTHATATRQVSFLVASY